MNLCAKKPILGFMADPFSASEEYFMETDMGIVTRRGDWFHTTREQIEGYAPGLLDNVSLASLIKDAMAWVRSASSLSLTLLYILLFVINPWFAAGITVAFHWFWYHNKSGFIIRGMASFLRFINSDGFLFIIAFVSLSLLGFQQEYVATGVGIFFFFVMKPGLLKKGWDRLRSDSDQELTLNDRVLKMVIIKQAMKENVAPSNVQQMEERFKDLAFSRKNKK